MSFGEKRVVKFERRSSPPSSKNHVFIASVTVLAASVFAVIMFWPATSPTFRPLASSATSAINNSFVSTDDITYEARSRPTPSLTYEASTRSTQADTSIFRCTVTTIYDGDGPIHCREGQSVRLHAIAAREMDETCRPGHPCPAASGISAKRELQSLALGHTLRCEQTGTSYNRVTAICWTESGLELNCAMVRSGKAMIWDNYDRKRHICS
ncbi:MAG: nuclease [Pseudomonadota bacterium]